MPERLDKLRQAYKVQSKPGDRGATDVEYGVRGQDNECRRQQRNKLLVQTKVAQRAPATVAERSLACLAIAHDAVESTSPLSNEYGRGSDGGQEVLIIAGPTLIPIDEKRREGDWWRPMPPFQGSSARPQQAKSQFVSVKGRSTTVNVTGPVSCRRARSCAIAILC